MTIAAGDPRISYTASGATDFLFDFPIWAKTDLKVYSNEVLQAVDTDYTVTFAAGSEAGGTVSFVSAPTAGYIVEIVRRLPTTRPSDFATSGPFSMSTLNEQLDKLTAQQQDQGDEVLRAFILPATTAGVSTQLPEPVGLQLVRWNAAGTALEGVTVADLSTTVQASLMIRDTYNDGVDFTAGVTTALTLTDNPGTEGNTQVYFDGEYQSKVAYNVSGTTITFTSPITAGTSVVEIMQIQAAEPQSVSQATTLLFETSPGAVTPATGKLWWNASDDTLNIGLSNGVVLQVGAEISPLYRNQSGASMANGAVVYVVSSTGDNPTVELAKADAIATSKVIAVTTQTIAHGTDGHCTKIGRVRDINTTGTPVSETWVDGDQLWLSPTTAGTMTNVEPTTTSLVVPVATVVLAHATAGILDVDIGQPLATDVALGTSNAIAPTQRAVKTYVDAKVVSGVGVSSFTPGDTTPSVAGGNIFLADYDSSPASITFFHDGVDGQTITVIVSGTGVDFTNGVSLHLAGAANWTTAADGDTITLVFSSGKGSAWYEVSRSVN
jgi:hypothetical protein